MKFIILLKADKNTDAGALPDEKLLTAMGKYNDEMAKAGVLLAAEGLHPSSKGARVRLSEGKRTVTDGPFPEANQLIAGFGMIQIKSKEEAIELGESVALTRFRAKLKSKFAKCTKWPISAMR